MLLMKAYVRKLNDEIVFSGTGRRRGRGKGTNYARRVLFSWTKFANQIHSKFIFIKETI